MAKNLEQESKILERDDPLGDLFFDPSPAEKIIETENATFQFTIKGLSQFEIEEISGHVSKEVEMDPDTGKPIVRLHPGQYNFQIVLRGVERAACNGEPIPWNEDIVKRLRSEIRDEILEEIRTRSDGLAAFKKSS